MSDERRRYFRITDTIGITYHVMEGDSGAAGVGTHAPDLLDLVTKQDEQIEQLLLEVADENPKVAELVTVFNQKLERIVSQMVMESRLVGRIAHRIKEANISACGVAFYNDEKIAEGARLKLELTLFPAEKSITVYGLVVDCEPIGPEWYWRIDFYDMSEKLQEALIQHVVQSQGQQLKKIRGN
ncbi:MAG: PilZ domain-containing protein [Agarilytica sp.]